MRTAVYTARDRKLANLIWREGPLSRSDLMNLTGIHRNLVGTSADRLLKLGLVREASSHTTGPGRPSLPLEINPTNRTVLGLAISPGQVELATLSLRGELIGRVQSSRTASPKGVVGSAQQMLLKQLKNESYAVGISVTGLVDLDARKLLFSSAAPSSRDVSLQPLFDACGTTSLVIDNDQHALAARWLLTHRADPQEDIVLVGFGDGRMGASQLSKGRPSHGCVLSANELGHTRLPVMTPQCFCGQTGCLERICSSEFIHFCDKSSQPTLLELARDRSLAAEVFDRIIQLLGIGFSNIVNFSRPNRLVLASPLGRQPAFAQALVREIRLRVLPALAERVRIEWWDESIQTSAENAAWLALASTFYQGWQDGSEYDITRGNETD
jgi:predicted NBD/HSP70 family sugar kinase